MVETTKIAIFKGKEIRKTIYKNEWWFSIIDIVTVLTDSNIPRRYWSDLKIKLKKEGFIEVYEKIVQLKLEAPDRKLRDTDCANTETIFRIIQTIPSHKADKSGGREATPLPALLDSLQPMVQLLHGDTKIIPCLPRRAGNQIRQR